MKFDDVVSHAYSQRDMTLIIICSLRMLPYYCYNIQGTKCLNIIFALHSTSGKYQF